MRKNGETCFVRVKRYKHIIMLAALCAIVWFAKSDAGERFADVFSEKDSPKEVVVVIDAGHGGADPGKVGLSGTKKKEINLAIAFKLAERLKKDGIQVVMTRETDTGLYSETARNKKREDMEERVRMITEAEPVCAISIHQNSFPQESCKGAQMFYYQDSEQSKSLAELLQKAFAETLQDGNKRQAKANSEYYLLRKTKCPIVIAECGFLSNPTEEALLVTGEYQEKVAEALYRGFLQWWTGRKVGNPNEDRDCENKQGTVYGRGVGICGPVFTGREARGVSYGDGLRFGRKCI